MDIKSNMQKEQYNLSNLEAGFREYLTAVIKLKPVSIKNYLSDIRYFVGWLTQNSSDELMYLLSNLSEADLLEYKDYLSASELPKKTINRRLSTIRSLCSFLISQAILTENPARNILNLGSKKPHIPTIDSLLPQDEIKDLTHYLHMSHGLTEKQSQRSLEFINDFLSTISQKSL